MYSLTLACLRDAVEMVSTELWEAGTAGIREIEHSGKTILIAGFETQREIPALAAYQSEWSLEEDTDWTLATKNAWPSRTLGSRIFLAPVWNEENTPAGRVRVIHNPGLASGTGEHPCTQLALLALEKLVSAGMMIADIGTGSALLALTALQLGAHAAVALDTDEGALQAARENFELNGFPSALAAGSADCLSSACADVVVANISGSVLVAISDELVRVLKKPGHLILTGFPDSELAAMQQVFGIGAITAINEWRCLALHAL